ncbi:PIN domain nuclease [Glycomyces tarimensis]
MAVAQYLVDKSVLARQAKPNVAQRLLALSDRGLLGLCGVTEMEMIYSARSITEGDSLSGWFKEFEWLPTPDSVWSRAIEVQLELLSKSLHRTVKMPDLIIACTAERHGVTVLHYDRDYERIAEVTGQSTEWIVPPGEAD